MMKEPPTLSSLNHIMDSDYGFRVNPMTFATGLMDEFLNQHGWSVAHPIAGDASARRYFRVAKNNQSAILMDNAGTDEGLADFIRIGGWLNDIGLKAPEIYEADESGGYLLLEDFGDVSFKQAMERGEDTKELYALAAEILEHLKAQDCPLELPDYYSHHIHDDRRFVIDWYVPALRGEDAPGGMVEDYLCVWDEIERSLPPCPQGFVHGDYHVENMLWLPGEEGMKRCGIIDFQGAMSGPVAYDMVNLLEDARVDVPGDIKAEILEGQDALVQSWTRILGTQFHCRVIGLFIKLAVEDGKTQYLQYLPRMVAYIHEGLEDPLLAPLKRWFKEQGIMFDAVPEIDLTEGKAPAQE